MKKSVLSSRAAWIFSLVLRRPTLTLLALALLFPAAARAQSETDLYDDGMGLLGQKKFAEAEAKFRQSVEADPRYKEAWQALADTLRAENKTEQAAAVQEMADAAPDSRAGAAPKLTSVQKMVLKAATSAPAAAVLPAPPGPDAALPAAAPAVDNVAPAPQPKSTVPDRPLAKSALVAKGPSGALVVTQKNGKGVDGVALSQHDMEIGSPSIAVAAGGTIHVAFVEKHRTTYAYAVYHRASSDGGKTWTEAKNLTEDMVGVGVGHCQILADAGDRVYVIWRAGLGPNFSADINPHSGNRHTNLWFRVLQGGKWSKGRLFHPPGSPEQQGIGALSFFAAVDAAGHAQVIWNETPGKSHPEVIGPYGGRIFNGIGSGLVFQSTLDGTAATPPREIFMPVVSGIQQKDAYCDGLDTLNGYVDAAGNAHFVAAVSSIRAPVRGISRYELIENDKAGEFVDLPELSFHAWADVPTLLIDAKGRHHVIALYRAGERPAIRDYAPGSQDDPTVIRSAAPVKGTIDSFQASQGPGGRMVVIIQANDTGETGDADSFVTVSTGDGQWSPLVNLTNNAGRKSFASRQTSSQSNIAIEKNYIPGVSTAAFDRDGHLLILMVNSERSLFGSTALGVTIAGGSTSKPTLRFLKF